MSLRALQERLGYQFGDMGILMQAMTHTSYGHEHLSDKPIAYRNNERLEFLGDSILNVIVSDILLEVYPEASEGRLSKTRAAVVNEKTLAQIAKSIRLAECLRLGKGEEQTSGREKASILAGAMEALIAAIYLDGGFSAVYPVVRHLFRPLFNPIQSDATHAFPLYLDHKSQLQELAQARWKIAPSYHLLSTQGPDHAKRFEVEVRMKGDVIATAIGTSKKEAEQHAAEAAIQMIDWQV